MGSEKESHTEHYGIEESSSSSEQNLNNLQRLLNEKYPETDGYAHYYQETPAHKVVVVRRTEDLKLMGCGGSSKEAYTDLYQKLKGVKPLENTAYMEDLRNYVMAGSDKFRPGSMIQAYSKRPNEYTACVFEYVISGEGDDQISAYRNVLNATNKFVNDIPFGRMFKPVCTREDFTQDIL